MSTIKKPYDHGAKANEKNAFFRGYAYEKRATELKICLNYDLNGNIQAITRYDKNGAMDVLNYDYGTGLAKGNRLLSVSDAGTTEGFTDGNTTGDDYGYDANGNMIIDKNKGITSIEYNHLNLPSKVIKDDGQYIKYIYDAAGIKLAQEVYNAGDTLQKRTDYIGEFIYENDTLQIIQHEEGRIVPNAVTGAFEYQYKIADHLGNTRLMFTSVPKTIEFTLNYESDPNNADDETLFKNVNIGAVGDYNSTSGAYQDATPYSHAQVLYSSPNSQTGSILAIPVGKGDQISATVNAKYIDAPANGSVVAGSIAASLINAFTGSVNGVTEGGTATINGSFGNDPLIGTAGFDYEDVNAPKAFLNMMFLPEDESISLVNGSTFMYDQIADGSTEAVIDGISQNAFDVLTIQDFEATQSGYILVYVSNEGSLTDVYFDDLSVTVNESKIIQTSDYYPFGLQQAGGYIRTTAKETKYLYNGFERQDALDWGVYDYLARYYDPVIGRFLQVDPAADLMRRHSSYNYAFDNPIRYIDPDGMVATDVVEEEDCCGNNPVAGIGAGIASAFISKFNEVSEEIGEFFSNLTEEDPEPNYVAVKEENDQTGNSADIDGDTNDAEYNPDGTAQGGQGGKKVVTQEGGQTNVDNADNPDGITIDSVTLTTVVDYSDNDSSIVISDKVLVNGRDTVEVERSRKMKKVYQK